MMSSLFASVSGLRNHQVKMNVVGDNIANINTIGFKAGRVTFAESLVQTLKGASRPTTLFGGTNPIQMGLGMTVSSIDNLFQQGGLETTGQITDLAIQGNGFFVLADGGQEFYTRAGIFGIDANSYLVNPSTGLFVQGKMADSDGTIPATATIGKIRLPFGQQDPARATTRIELASNLDSSATTSNASLDSAGTTGIDGVSGIAKNGAGGTHNITITGNNGTRSQATGDNLASAVLTGAETLTSLGVTDVSGFSIKVDGTNTYNITGLTVNSTVTDLVNAINTQVSGVTAEIVGGEIRLTRIYAGDGASHNITTSASAAGNIVDRIFGVAAGGNFVANNGTAYTLVATDTFTPSRSTTAYPPVQLSLVVNPTTGFVTGISDLGNGGVTVSSTTQLSAGTAVINTEDTQHATSITAYDSQGGKHTVVFTFTKDAQSNRWFWEASLPGNEIIAEGGAGSVVFNADGSLGSFNFDGGASTLRINPRNGALDMVIDLEAGSTGGFNGLTGFASSFTATARNQDGYGMGLLTTISIDAEGVITGIFSNGVSRALAQIAVADFSNPSGLLKSGNNLYRGSANSGDAIKGIAGKTVSGTITSGALEMSNVDLAQEFTNMIVAQRGFQANARVITTSDEMLTELVNLKR